jgi:hypothetical protein
MLSQDVTYIQPLDNVGITLCASWVIHQSDEKNLRGAT